MPACFVNIKINAAAQKKRLKKHLNLMCLRCQVKPSCGRFFFN
jgi:hypothetical protein